MSLLLAAPAPACHQPDPEDGCSGYGKAGGNHVLIQRVWEGTTRVSIRLRAEFRAETLPDGSPWVSFLYGPVVLAAREGNAGVESFEAPDEHMGHVASGSQVALATASIVSAHEPADAVVLANREGLAADLMATRDGSPVRVRLEPFAGIHDERYTVYWPTGPAPELRAAELATMDEEAAEMEAVIDAVTAGEQQPEADHFFAGEGTKAGGRTDCTGGPQQAGSRTPSRIPTLKRPASGPRSGTIRDAASGLPLTAGP